MMGNINTSVPKGRRCPNCNELNSEEASFCGECGTRLIPTKVKCPDCGSTVDSDDKFCTSCGLPMVKKL